MIGYFEVVRDFDLELTHSVKKSEDVSPHIGTKAPVLKSDIDKQHEKSLELLACQSVDLLVRLDQGPTTKTCGKPFGSFSSADQYDQLLELSASLFFEVRRLGRVSQ